MCSHWHLSRSDGVQPSPTPCPELRHHRTRHPCNHEAEAPHSLCPRPLQRPPFLSVDSVADSAPHRAVCVPLFHGTMSPGFMGAAVSGPPLSGRVSVLSPAPTNAGVKCCTRPPAGVHAGPCPCVSTGVPQRLDHTIILGLTFEEPQVVCRSGHAVGRPCAVATPLDVPVRCRRVPASPASGPRVVFPDTCGACPRRRKCCHPMAILIFVFLVMGAIQHLPFVLFGDMSGQGLGPF